MYIHTQTYTETRAQQRRKKRRQALKSEGGAKAMLMALACGMIYTYIHTHKHTYTETRAQQRREKGATTSFEK
jgi:hypothetical protein